MCSENILLKKKLSFGERIDEFYHVDVSINYIRNISE